MTNALRLELAPKNIRVSALYVAYMDTDMLGGFDVSKLDPRTSRHSPSTASPAAAPHQPAESPRNRGIPPGPVSWRPRRAAGGSAGWLRSAAGGRPHPRLAGYRAPQPPGKEAAPAGPVG